MLQELFGGLYQAMHGAQGPLFSNQVYPQSGAVLVVSTLLTAVAYYYGIGWITARYVLTRHWFAMLMVNSLICMLMVLAICRFIADVGGAPVMTLVLIQGLYAAMLFAVTSAAIKWGSPNARRTPF